MGDKRAGRHRDRLAELIDGLRQAGLEPGSRELAEALWLAGHLTPGEPATGPGPSGDASAPRESAPTPDHRPGFGDGPGPAPD
ncbi:hypothetical protein, partial [Streptomyces harbinensis]